MISRISSYISFLFNLVPENISDAVFKCKWIISAIYIDIFRYLNPKRLDLYDPHSRESPEKIHAITPKKEFELESPFPETHLLKAKDEIFFYGVSSKGERLVVSISRRCDQKADARVHLRLESGKTYELIKTTDEEKMCLDKHVFSCGNLQLHYRNPMRKWRLFYNGYLRETDEHGSQRPIYVKFALIWTASSDVFDFSEDIDKKILAEWLANAEWKFFTPPIKGLQQVLNAYGQSGVIQGTVSIGDDILEKEIYLFGQRMRDLGSKTCFENMEFSHILGYTFKNGMFVHLGEFSTSNSLKKLPFGYIVNSDSSIKAIDCLTLEETSQSKGKNTFKEVSYNIDGEIQDCICQDNTACADTLNPTVFELNNKKGNGLFIKRKQSNISSYRTSYKPVLEIPKVIPRTVVFENIICQIPDVTGGKGSSLGKLTQYSKDLQTFIVPEGIVVTTSSYTEFVSQQIRSKISELEEVLYDNTDGDIKESCERVQRVIIGTDCPSLIRLSIEKDMKKVFGGDFSRLQFAVRSSATGEDTEQMSAAGQMDTFLGVSGLDQILTAVKKCWASQFSFVAVQYKKRYGQCINSPMAVVIQKMISCDTAGVLFTCDPLTGNPTLLTITANYGLGESVVSGSEEPDTIILERDINDQLSIKNKEVGAKTNKIVVQEDGGTREESVPENQTNTCCLTDEMALRLANLAVKLESYYKSARDIEWGYHNNNLYIFQSRPITSGMQDTLYELDHEFDSPLRVVDDFFSTSNVGEVFPGAISTIGTQVLFRSFMNATKAIEKQTEFQTKVSARYYMHGWGLFQNHSIFNVADLFHNLNGETSDSVTQATLIAFFGRIPDDKDLHAVVKERYGVQKRESSWMDSWLFMKNLVFSSRILKNTLKQYEGFRIPVEKAATTSELLHLILLSMIEYNDALKCHMICTHMSAMWNMMVLTTLKQDEGCFNDNVYRDFSNMLKTSSVVESADVPSAIQNLAIQVSKDKDPEDFKSLTTEEALKWLQNSSTLAGKRFNEFIKKHGHRCLFEFDVHSKSWRADPKPLVKLLQKLSGTISKDSLSNKKENDKTEFQVKLGLISKLKLKLIVPLSRKAVQDRERSKSLLVKVIDEFRKAFEELTTRMVSEGRIPERELTYFLTIEELSELLETRNPKSLARASQRLRRHPVLDKYIFPELMKGLPKPINAIEETAVPTAENFSLKGIPVSQGIAKGYVRKAIRLEEAANLKPGEILLTYSTDIGWTPYFPTLAGVVTEIGGLISHGAVVSREFGIPCIAGLHQATKYFQTGDYVMLDGNKGLLTKISPPSN